MKPTVTVIDYGMGNLYSVCRAFESIGSNVKIASSPDELKSAYHLVLPGVGAFQSGMDELRQRNLVEAIRSHALQGKPLMGICLGMQMLTTMSEEFGAHDGIDLIPGRVRPLPQLTTDGEIQKIPHIGWTELYNSGHSSWNNTALTKLNQGNSVYSVHSYFVDCKVAANRLAVCRIGGHEITAAIQHESIIGCQFHPEKSGPVGLSILECFLL